MASALKVALLSPAATVAVFPLSETAKKTKSSATKLTIVKPPLTSWVKDPTGAGIGDPKESVALYLNKPINTPVPETFFN